MPTGDELASVALSSSQKAIEIAAELVRMLASVAKTAAEKTVELSSAARQPRELKGEVARSELITESAQNASPIKSSSNFLAADAKKLAEKAKSYGIPVTLTGSEGGKQTVEFLGRDASVVNQIIQELMQERLQSAPQDIKCFAVSRSNVAAIKEQFEQNGVECQFAQSANGKIYCLYPTAAKEAVSRIKAEYKAMQSDISEKFRAERVNGVAVMTDDKLGKSISFVNEKNEPLTRESVMETIQAQLKYSRAEAEIAANKFCDDLALDKEKYLVGNKQLEQISALKTNIRFESDSALLKGTTFSAVSFKAGSGTHIFVEREGKGVVMSPATMSAADMQRLCVSNLAMSEDQAQEAVAKTLKIDEQINSRLHETVIYRENGAQSLNIERTSQSSFSVKAGSFSRSYDFADPQLSEKMSRELGISDGKAQQIINKAAKQSAFANRLREGLKKAAAKKPNVQKEKLDIGKGVRK